MKINQYNGTKRTYKKNRSIKYIAIHYTAGASSKQGSAKGNCNWWQNGKDAKGKPIQASADFVVDDVEFWQYNNDISNYYCWSVGDKNGKGSYYGKATNSNTISIEICSTNRTGKMTTAGDTKNYYFTDKVLKNAIELTKYLMQKYNIDVDHVIRHYDITTKACPSSKGWYGSDISEWKWFKAQLTTKPKSNGSYTVEVKSPDGTLNLREEPNANSKLIQVLKNGDRVIIIGQKGDWLQTNWNRWLNGKYTKVVE